MRRWPKGIGIAVTVALLVLPAVRAGAGLGDPPPTETHYPAGSGQLAGTELVEDQTAPPCFRATRTLFGLRGAGAFEGRTATGDPVIYNAQVATGQTLYGNGPLQVQVENTEVYYHGILGTHGTEAGGGAGCSPSTTGSPVPAEFRIFAADGGIDTDGDSDVDILTGSASVYRLNGTDKVPCVGVGSFARGSSTSSGVWRAEWTLSADCIVVGNPAGTPGTGTAPRGTFMTNHGTHLPCFNYPCADNVTFDYQQYLPKPGPYLRLSGPDSATVGCDGPVAVTARLTDTGWPAAGVAVSFSVAGPGPAVPASASTTTDANGSAAFSFSAAVSGDYTVTATATLNAQAVSAIHVVRFGNPPPPSITLASAPNRWQTEEQVSVTATVDNACGPLPGAPVDFSVAWPAQDTPWTGQATPASGTVNTGSDGRAAFSFSGDRAGDYRVTATIGLPTGEQPSATRTLHLDIRDFKRAGALSVPDPTGLPGGGVEAAVMDLAGRFAYFGAGGKVEKIDLTTFERVGTLTPSPGTVSLIRSAAIDPAGRFAYFGDATRTVLKVDLETFVQAGVLQLQAVANNEQLESAVIDPAGRFAYLGTVSAGQAGRIVKVDLATFTEAGAIAARVGDQSYGTVESAVMGPGGRYAYFGTRTSSTGRIVKVDLATFQITQTLTLANGEVRPTSAVIDPAGDFAYFSIPGTPGSPGRVVKVNLRTFERVGAVTLLPGETFSIYATGVIDPTGAFAYFAANQDPDATLQLMPAAVVKIDLRTFERVHAITLEPGQDSSENDLRSAVIDPAGNFAYFGTYAQGNVKDHVAIERVVKVQLRRPPNPVLVAGADTFALSGGSSLTVPAPGVLANDGDTAGADPLRAGQASDPAGGSVTLRPDGSFSYTPHPGFAGADTFTYTATDGMDYSPPATVTVNVAAPQGLTGRAFGYMAHNISLFGGAQPDTGPTPTVALAPDGSNSPQTAGAPTGLVQEGPATLFTSDRIDLSSAVSPGGATVITSSAISNVNKATTQPSTGSEILTADRIEGACRATATGATASTTVTNGSVRTKAQDPGFPDEGLVTIPTNPPANYTVEGYLYLSATSQDNFRIVFNEQVLNPDGSVMVNPVHEYFLGPVLKGDMALGQSVCRWGPTTIRAVKAVADFDGNGATDHAVYRPSQGVWYVQGGTTIAYGAPGDVPVPGDYDGDAKADIAVFRPANGVWYLHLSGGGDQALAHGAQGDVPVPADYDGDGKADIAVFRPSNGVWYLHLSGGGDQALAYGAQGDVPVPADYDGDAKADIAVFRPGSGVWYLHVSGGGGDQAVAYGTSGDVPVPGDYDGDAKADVGVYRPGDGVWYVQGGATTAWGTTGDVPLPLPPGAYAALSAS